MNLRGKRWLWVAITVIVVAGATTGVWLTQRDTGPSPEECAVVEQLGQDWLAMTSSVETEMSTGPGGPDSWLSVADQEAAMGGKIRSAAQSVSTASLKDELNKWADAAELTAQMQRDSANRAPGLEPSAAEGNAFVESSVKTYEATAALRTKCPNMPAQPKTTQ